MINTKNNGERERVYVGEIERAEHKNSTSKITLCVYKCAQRALLYKSLKGLTEVLTNTSMLIIELRTQTPKNMPNGLPTTCIDL